MSLVPRNNNSISSRSLEVTRTYLQRGQTVSRSVWVRVNPKNPLLKAAMVPPVAAFMVTMLILMLLALGFVLLAMALLGAMGRTKEDDVEKG